MAKGEISFIMENDPSVENLATDGKMRLLASCIISQQNAGFKDAKGKPVADMRVLRCANCGAHGYNTGWGYWKFECGAEQMPDGEPSRVCTRRRKAA